MASRLLLQMTLLVIIFMITHFLGNQFEYSILLSPSEASLSTSHRNDAINWISFHVTIQFRFVSCMPHHTKWAQMLLIMLYWYNDCIGFVYSKLHLQDSKYYWYRNGYNFYVIPTNSLLGYGAPHPVALYPIATWHASRIIEKWSSDFLRLIITEVTGY